MAEAGDGDELDPAVRAAMADDGGPGSAGMGAGAASAARCIGPMRAGKEEAVA